MTRTIAITGDPQVALISTLHDPNGDLFAPLQLRQHALAWYRAVYVSVTDSTDQRIIDTLLSCGVRVALEPPGAAGSGRLRSLALALRDDHHAYLYIDFDRWLHWVGQFPGELRALPERIQQGFPHAWYLCIGRTERAFDSHPEVQRLAERATSRALELVLRRQIDATAGGCWLSPEGAELIVAQSTERTLGTDLEWPALIWRHDPHRLEALLVEGLEFESAEFATRGITAAGSEDLWVEHVYQQPEMWQRRFQLAADSIAALNRVLSLSPSTRHG